MKAVVAVALALLVSCNPARKPRDSEPTPVAQAGTAAHTEDDCGQAHGSEPGPPAPTATFLSDAARADVTTLRVSAHLGSVIIRKDGQSWTTGGTQGCTVSPARIDRALSNLSGLSATSTDERPADGSEFELQIVALSGQERLLHFDIADRKDGKDLLQLADASTYRLQGLDREIWSPDPAVWCAPEP
jgi:hypothetical protein